MIIKRSMTVTLACFIIILFTPVSARALTEGSVSLAVLLHDPLFMLVVLAGFLALGGSLIVICVILYRRARISASALGGQPGGDRQFDFSDIETPVEIQALCFDGEKGTGLDADSADTTVFLAADGWGEAPISVSAAGESDVLRNPGEFGNQGEFGNPDNLENDLFDPFEVEEPLERPSMEFTDDMIQQVIEGVERRREAERAEQQREQQREPVVMSYIAEKGKNDQQATIEWLATGRKQQGRHFRAAHFRVQDDETKAESLVEYPIAAMKHSREQGEVFYQRVG
jgi:hypothetical protein